MPINNNKLFTLLLLSILLNGCFVYPVSEKMREHEITGDIDGLKSNLDEKIIRVNIAHGAQWIFSPEGPARFMDADKTRHYYLDKNGVRIKLDFLKATDSKTDWNTIINISNQWFAFNVNTELDYFKIIQFDSNGNSEGHNIQAYPISNLTELYIDKAGKVIVWKQINKAYQQYDLNTKKRINYTLSSSDINELIKISPINTPYNDISFYEAVKNDNADYLSRRAVAAATGYAPLLIVETDSVRRLRFASIHDWYMVRWAAALNPNTPDEIIEKLTGDPSFYVANEARKRTISISDE